MLRNPFLAVLWLSARNRLQRIPSHKVGLVALVLTVIVSASALLWASHSAQVAAWLRFAEAHGGWVLLLAALQSASTVATRRRKLTVALSQSWIAATPRAAATLGSSIVVGTLWTPVWQWVLVSLLLATQAIGNADTSAARHLLQLMAAGFAGGVCAGWLVPSKPWMKSIAGSRYVPGRRTAAKVSIAPNLLGLSRWPIAQTFASATPDAVRWPLMAAMLAVGAGSSIIAGLMVVCFWMIVLYMVTLLSATLRVARQAAQWLQATPLPFTVFFQTIATRSFVHQLVGSVLVAGFVVINSKMSCLDAALLVSPWIALVILSYSTILTFSFHMQRGAGASIAVMALIIAALETLQRGLAVPLSLSVAAWHFNRGARPVFGKGAST